MRIAVVNWSRRREGGAETYVAALMPDLVAAGHEVALWSESDAPEWLPHMALPDGVTTWCAATTGLEPALEALRSWRPDVLFAHGFSQARVEVAIPTIGPGVALVHNYHATCISGSKLFRRPVARPCDRALGPACLALYLPRGCGGRSPLSMLRAYDEATRKLGALGKYTALATLSERMREELVRNGIPPERIHKLPLFAMGAEDQPGGEVPTPEGPVRFDILFVGRFTRNKGGHVLLAALPKVHEGLARPIRVVFVGDGPERDAWMKTAQRLTRAHPGIEVVFPGWLSGDATRARYREAHLLVVPSVWPEPFGLVGIEGAREALPAVAFDVGGVGEWLRNGTSGILAPADPPTAGGLAAAIVTALGEPRTHARLCAGARWVASRWDHSLHVREVLALLERVAREGRRA